MNKRGTPHFRDSTGFTLIELLVVVAIISLLSSVVLASLSGARENARDARRQQDINQLQTALELYYNANGNYPDLENWAVSDPNYSNSFYTNWTTLMQELDPYLQSPLADPVENFPVTYLYRDDNINGGPEGNCGMSNTGNDGSAYQIIFATESANLDSYTLYDDNLNGAENRYCIRAGNYE